MRKDSAALREIGLGRRARHRSAHGVAVVLDDVDDRQLPQRGHVEALVDLALVGGAVAEIGQRDVLVAAIAVGESEAGAERNLRADDAVAAVEILLLGEHVHRAALATGVASTASGQLGHHAARRHVHRQHVAVIAIGGDHLVAVDQRHLHAGDDGFLADVEMAEAADEAHAVELAGLLLEAADEEHAAIGCKLLFLGEVRRFRRYGCCWGFRIRFRFSGRLLGGDGHSSLPVAVSLRTLRGLFALKSEKTLACGPALSHAEKCMADMRVNASNRWKTSRIT